MSTITQPAPMIPGTGVPPRDTRRFSIDEFEWFAERVGDDVELIDGYIVERPEMKPSHVLVSGRLKLRLEPVLPAGWSLREDKPLRIDNINEPRPDFAVVKGGIEDYPDRHPGPADTAMVIEVSDSSLPRDQGEKRLIYARGGVPLYWIVNLVDRQIEAYSDPVAGGYGSRVEYPAGKNVPIVIGGVEVGTVTVSDIFP
jgi:Uma2 family endonuclease